MNPVPFSLERGEQVLWQACPAPRAFVFRRWRLSLISLGVWLGMSLWLGVLGGAELPGDSLKWVVPVWVLAACGVIAPPVAGRFFWRYQRYWLTDRRLVVRNGPSRRHVKQLAVKDVEACKISPLSGSVVTIRLRSRADGATATLYCLEGGADIFRTLGEKEFCKGNPVDSATGS